jgi:allantoate deiminase
MHDRPVMEALYGADWVLRRLDDVASCSDSTDGITRLFLSPAHARAITLVRGWMEAAGLVTRLDAAGTLIGVRAGARPDLPRLLLGSHIDSVRDAGRYDGCLGVVGAIAVAGRLGGTKLPYALEIRAFGDEEGVRFPVTLTGAHATAGRFMAEWLGLADQDGVTLGAALAAFGLDPAALDGCVAAGAFAYLELHIEQGPVLEAADAPLGIVTAISGAARFAVTVTGRAGHAGTVPMAQRQDALAAAAAMIVAVQAIARGRDGVVATVGRLEVAPGAVNVIPGRCVFSIDLRAARDATRDAAELDIRAALETVAREQGVAAAIVALHAAPAVGCDARLQAHLAAAVAGAGLPVVRLPSGAGHDAMAVAALCPIGMLFLRCTGGISHHPDEAVRRDDVACALDVLERALRTLDPFSVAAAG